MPFPSASRISSISARRRRRAASSVPILRARVGVCLLWRLRAARSGSMPVIAGEIPRANPRTSSVPRGVWSIRAMATACAMAPAMAAGFGCVMEATIPASSFIRRKSADRNSERGVIRAAGALSGELIPASNHG